MSTASISKSRLITQLTELLLFAVIYIFGKKLQANNELEQTDHSLIFAKLKAINDKSATDPNLTAWILETLKKELPKIDVDWKVFLRACNSWLEFQQQENKTQVEKSIDQHSHVAQQNMDTRTTPFSWILWALSKSACGECVMVRAGHSLLDLWVFPLQNY